MQSNHPIAAVDGLPARLSHLIELQTPDDPSRTPRQDNAFSRSTQHTLRFAAAFPATETEDGRPVVDPGSYLLAELALAAGRADVQMTPELPNRRVLKVLLGDALAGVERLKDRLDRGRSGTAPGALETAIAAPSLTAMLAEAARIADESTGGQEIRVDARHALAACLATLEAQQVIWSAGLATEAPTIVIDRVRNAFLEAVLGPEGSIANERGDDPSVWQGIAERIQPDTRVVLPEPERRSDTHYVRDSPAATLADDRLGLAAEARALAEVMCLREPGPPLAIGLFGDWGSGKSTYMNLIEAAIGEIGERTAVDPAAKALFVDGVVHIKFNAWHYNDADLWTSLTSEFFRQLRNGGHVGRSDADYQALVKEVAARVAAAEQEAEDVGEDLGQKRAAAEGQRQKLAGLARDSARRRAEALAEASREVARSVADADATRIGDVLAALGHDAPAEGAAAAKALAVEADRALQGFGQVSATGRALLNVVAGRGGLIAKRVYAAFALGFLGIGGLIWLKAAYPETFGAGEAALLGLIAALGAVGAAVAQVHRFVDPVFRTANAFAEKLETAEATAAAEEKTARDALARLEAEIAGIEARRQTLMADAARFRGGAPEQVLDFFLNESDATRAFDSGLGVVSRVRRAFEQLDAIFREAAAEGRRRPDAARFERIVLYIDDLDRCRAKQVVEVLEAAHLLLAFPLFVVVVGVDARWLEKSLLEYYKDKLDNGGKGDAALSGQATVHDFLEKIFQIPVRLRRLSTLPGEAYRSYIRAAAGPVSYGDASGQSRDEGGTGAGRTDIHRVDVEIKPAPPAAGAAAEQVRLTREEVELFETLGPVVGKTPRAIKRFVNLYRLMRGMRRGLALDEFLGVGAPPGAARPYAAVQFWLAADVGLAETQAGRLRRAIAAAGAIDSVDAILFAPLIPPVPGAAEPPDMQPGPPYTPAPAWWADMSAFWQSVPSAERRSLYDAMQAALDLLPAPDGMPLFKSALEETRRFSAGRT